MSEKLLEGMLSSNVENHVLPTGLQLFDIAAIQELYGRNYETRTGNTTYSASTAFQSSRPNGAFIYTIWDGKGIDRIDASGFYHSKGAVIDLRQRNDALIRQQQQREADQRRQTQEAQQRQLEERQRRENEYRQREQQRIHEAAEKRRQEQQDRGRQPASGGPSPPPGRGGGNNNDPPRPGSGHNSSDPFKGYDKDIRNLADQRAPVRVMPANPFNDMAKQKWGEKAILPYEVNSKVNDVKSNPVPKPDLPLLQFRRWKTSELFNSTVNSEYRPTRDTRTEWHASRLEMGSKLLFPFADATGADMKSVIRSYLNLPNTPTHFVTGNLGTKITDVRISRTVSGRQQAQIRSNYMNYTEDTPIKKFMDFLTFKPKMRK